ncbi:MAG: T9SS type A sorting domain-containing protein [candidate division Zixibacteria bacterium]|nr:T9SS type A sorting domain-containing protein [candidate division Zixibacteria bacterium]
MILSRFLAASAIIVTLSCTIASAQIDFIEHDIDYFSRAAGVYACDIDNDGDLDALGAGLGSGEIAMWRNDGGNPVNWTYSLIDQVPGAIYVYSADIDGDGLMDAVAAAATTGKIVWWQNGGGDPIDWLPQIIGSGFLSAHGVHAEDVDGDCDIDILGASEGLDQIAWWRNDGGDPIEWTMQVIADNFLESRAVSTADVDGDGDIDVLGAAFRYGDIKWWRNDGGNPIAWTEFEIDSRFAGAHHIYVCDLDRDGDPDVLSAGCGIDQIAWWRNDGGDPVVWTKQVIGRYFRCALTVWADDFDNDGDTDVVGTAWAGDEILWWRNDGGNPIGWTELPVNDNYNGPWPVCTGDLDGDGDADILGGSDDDSKITWWENESSSGFDNDPSWTTGEILMLENYPDPFNSSTVIKFELLRETNVILAIYNILGREIELIIKRSMPAGSHNVKWEAATLNNGVYFCRLKTQYSSEINKMLLLK